MSPRQKCLCVAVPIYILWDASDDSITVYLCLKGTWAASEMNHPGHWWQSSGGSAQSGSSCCLAGSELQVSDAGLCSVCLWEAASCICIPCAVSALAISLNAGGDVWNMVDACSLWFSPSEHYLLEIVHYFLPGTDLFLFLTRQNLCSSFGIAFVPSVKL